MSHQLRKLIPLLLASGLIVSCVSTNKAIVTSGVPDTTSIKVKTEAVPVPKFIEIRTWKILGIVSSYPDGMLTSIVNYQYDDAGLLLSEETLDANKILVSKIVYNRKPDGTTEKSSLNNTGELIGKEIAKYNGELVMLETQFNTKDEAQSTVDYTYDAKGRRESRTVKTTAGNQVTTVYTWKGDLLASIAVQDASGTTLKRFDRTYDSAKLLTREDEYDQSATVAGKIVYTYKNGFLVQENRQNATGGNAVIIKYVNDADGNPVEITWCDRLGNATEVKRQTWRLFTKTVQQQ